MAVVIITKLVVDGRPPVLASPLSSSLEIWRRRRPAAPRNRKWRHQATRIAVTASFDFRFLWWRLGRLPTATRTAETAAEGPVATRQLPIRPRWTVYAWPLQLIALSQSRLDAQPQVSKHRRRFLLSFEQCSSSLNDIILLFKCLNFNVNINFTKTELRNERQKKR